MSISYPLNPSTGAIVQSFPRRQYEKIKEIIDVVNDITDGTTSLTEVEVGNGTVAAPSMSFTSDPDTGIYRIGANNIGVAANGAKVLDIATTGLGITGNITISDTTDSTTKDTGSIITEGGIGVEKAIVAGTTITATTRLFTGAGAVGTPGLVVGANDNGIYEVSSVQQGFSIGNALVGGYNATGLFSNELTAQTALGSTPVGTVSIKEYSTGRDVVTELTLTNFIIGALAGAGAALGIGNIVYAFPAGQHLELVSSFSSLVLTAAGTAVATDTGLGSVIASGAISVLSGTGTFEDRLTGQTINTAVGGGAAVSALTAATAGIGTGISLNVAASVKNVFLNSAGTWNANNTGNLTASGTIVLKWTKM